MVVGALCLLAPLRRDQSQSSLGHAHVNAGPPMAQEIRQPGFTVPAGATDLWLIRHGESEPAVEGKSFPLKDGHGDPALHPNGQKQALAVGARLSMTRFDALYVTSLRRTHQTAAPLAAAQGLEPVEVADLREVFLGDWEGGLFRFKAAQNDPAYLRARSDGEWGHIPGAETTNALRARISGALESIHQAHKDQRVAAVVRLGDGG